MDVIFKDEIKHIFREFYRLKRPEDAAMFFITQNEVDINELMSFDYQAKKYYRAIWEFITKYTIDKIENGKYEQVLSDIIPKLEIESFTLRPKYKNSFDKDYLVNSYLLCLFKILVEKGMYDVYNYTISLLQIQGIDSRIISNIIMQDYSLMSPTLVMTYIDLGLFDPIDFCNLLCICKERYDFFWIDKLLEIYMSEETRILELFIYLNGRVEYKLIDKGKKFRVIKDIKSIPKDKELFEHVFNYVSKRIVLDANIMYLEKLNEAVNAYSSEKPRNLEMVNAYEDYATWFTSNLSNLDSGLMLFNYLNFDGEEGEEFPNEFYYLFKHEVIHMNDIMNTLELEDYQFFLRLFNMNRFKLYSNYNEELIDIIVNRMNDDNKLFLAEFALSKDTYISLNLSCYPYI